MMSSTASITNVAAQQFTNFQSGSNAAAAAPTNAPSKNRQQQPANQQAAQQQASMQYTGGQQRQTQQMSCLYTKQKTQKRKKWHDGRLILHSMGASLYDAHPPPGSGDPKLDECYLTRAQCDALIRQTETGVETEKFLIQVEGPWTVSTAPTAMAKPNVLVSQGMKKVITRKFRKPGAFVPPPQAPAVMRKRQRQPLQPGELQRRYYGDAVPQQQNLPPPAGAPPPAWNQGLQQQMNGQQLNGGRPGHFQGMNRPPPQQQQQQPVQKQMPMKNGNRSPQPPFQRGQEQPSPFQHGRPNTAPPPQQQGQPYVPNNGYNNGVARQKHTTPPTAPPYQPAVQQQQAQGSLNSAAQQQQQRPDLFVRNQFNPNQFFGEDEELSQEEGDDDDGGLGWNIQQAPRNQRPKPNTINVGKNQTNVAANRQESASPKPPGSTGEFVPQGQVTRPKAGNVNTNESSGNSAALSTNEILKLFGANLASAPVEAEAAVEKPVPDAVDQPVSDTQATTAKQGSSNFEFVLPPAAASDSSSDEESDDEETKY